MVIESETGDNNLSNFALISINVLEYSDDGDDDGLGGGDDDTYSLIRAAT